jgi:hypothetical protein
MYVRPPDTTTMVPPALLTLPSPWNRLDSDPRDKLESTASTRAAACSVLEQCLQGAAQLPEIPHESFPEWITVAWGLWSSAFVRTFGGFDEFRLDTIREAFAKQTSDLHDGLVQRYGSEWLREQALSLARTAEHWLDEGLRDSPDPVAVRRLHEILRKHWQGAWQPAYNLMWTVWSHDPDGSQAILRQIAEAPDAHPKLVERAQDLLFRS